MGASIPAPKLADLSKASLVKMIEQHSLVIIHPRDIARARWEELHEEAELLWRRYMAASDRIDRLIPDLGRLSVPPVSPTLGMLRKANAAEAEYLAARAAADKARRAWKRASARAEAFYRAHVAAGREAAA